jgi:hypothetical protein
MMKSLHTLFEAYAVKRYHTMRALREQTVGEHSAGVAALVIMLEPNARTALLRAALLHDTEELETGDMPAPTKWKHPDLAKELDRATGCFYDANPSLDPRLGELTPHERRVLVFCDMLDGAMWCHAEVRMGNRYALDVLSRYNRALTAFTREMPSHYADTLKELQISWT